ncbi:MAG: rod shape-determining protein MreC [Chthonomonadales bacterium]
MDPFTSAIRTGTAPFVEGAYSIRRWFSRQLGWIFHGRTLDAEVQRLRAENARLTAENARLREAEITARRLRSQLGFVQQLPHSHVAADVIALFPNPNFRTLVINRGSRAGVRVHSVVVAPEGLVGQVYDVAPTTSAVLLLTDAASAVGARVQRPTSRAVGVCKGNGTDLLTLAYLPQDADVRIGDTIISSGLGGSGGVYPAGLVIGTVASVSTNIAGAERIVKVKPAVDASRLEEVYVIK